MKKIQIMLLGIACLLMAIIGLLTVSVNLSSNIPQKIGLVGFFVGPILCIFSFFYKEK